MGRILRACTRAEETAYPAFDMYRASRRSFLRTLAVGVGAVTFGTLGMALGQDEATPPPPKPPKDIPENEYPPMAGVMPPPDPDPKPKPDPKPDCDPEPKPPYTDVDPDETPQIMGKIRPPEPVKPHPPMPGEPPAPDPQPDPEPDPDSETPPFVDIDPDAAVKRGRIRAPEPVPPVRIKGDMIAPKPPVEIEGNMVSPEPPVLPDGRMVSPKAPSPSKSKDASQ